MAEYIEREATVNLLQSLGSRDYRREKGTIQEAIKMVSGSEYTPAADVEPVRHGHWKPKAVMVRCLNARNYICSRCGHEPLEVTTRCPNCGAKMDEEVKSTAPTALTNQDIRAMHNELCLKCGKYKGAHLGACDGCRWKWEATQ